VSPTLPETNRALNENTRSFPMPSACQKYANLSIPLEPIKCHAIGERNNTVPIPFSTANLFPSNNPAAEEAEHFRSRWWVIHFHFSGTSPVEETGKERFRWWVISLHFSGTSPAPGSERRFFCPAPRGGCGGSPKGEGLASR